MNVLMPFLGALLISAPIGNASAQTIALHTCPTAGTARPNLHDQTAMKSLPSEGTVANSQYRVFCQRIRLPSIDNKIVVRLGNRMPQKSGLPVPCNSRK